MDLVYNVIETIRSNFSPNTTSSSKLLIDACTQHIGEKGTYVEGLKQAAHAKKQQHDDVSQKWADAKKHEEQLKKAKWKSVQALRKKLHTIQSAINMSMDGTEEDEVDSLMQICNMCHDICPTEFRTSMQHMEERLVWAAEKTKQMAMRVQEAEAEWTRAVEAVNEAQAHLENILRIKDQLLEKIEDEKNIVQ